MLESAMTIDKFGTKMWENEVGVLHRLDGPAIETSGGSKAWYKNGLRHRIDGPAVEWTDGSKYWYQNGLLHRIDGPAIERLKGEVEWYYKNDFLGDNLKGFWKLWKLLDEKSRQNVNLHMWLTRLQNV